MLAIILTQILACSEKSSEATCEYNGQTYAVGEYFDATDGCNSCSCEEFDGETSVSCTEIGCEELPIEECSFLSIDECESYEACTLIWASPVQLDEENQCFLWANSIEDVGCMSIDQTCPSAVTYSASPTDPSGCYGFMDGCTPEGWGSCEQGEYPECE